jgi:hypothetical protein
VRAVVANPLVDSCKLANDFRRAVAARIVDSEQLEVDSLGVECTGKAEQRRSDRPFFVVRGDDDGKLQTATLQRSTFRS